MRVTRREESGDAVNTPGTQTRADPGLNSLWRSRVILTRLIAIVVAGAAAWYSTVYGIRLTINEKADREVVAQIDHRLTVIETLLRSDVARQSELSDFREQVNQRLARIETLLESAHKGKQ